MTLGELRKWLDDNRALPDDLELNVDAYEWKGIARFKYYEQKRVKDFWLDYTRPACIRIQEK